MTEELKMRCQSCMNDFKKIDGRYVNYNFYCIPCSKHQPELMLLQPEREGNRMVIKRPEYTREQFIEYAYLTLGDLHPRAFRMMDKYHSEGATWFDMTRALEYFYVVKKGDKSKAGGSIGIIPYVYKEAGQWYTAREQQQLRKQQADLDSILRSKNEYKVIQAKAPKRGRERKSSILKPLKF